MSQQQYKQLQRQLRRLPLPQKIIKHGSTVLKHRFKLGKTKNFETIFTQLLDHEQYHKYIPNLLDAIYKDSKPKWYRDFNNIPYIRVKEHWPTVHIMDEIANSKTKKIYHEKLSSDFKVSDYVKGNDKSRNAFPLIRKYGEQVKSIPKLIEEVEKAYTFIVHSPRIGLTKHPFDVRHLPSKLGIPQHPVGLDMKLKETVSIVKNALENNQPIRKDQFQKFIQSYSTEINSNFYKHLSRKRESKTISAQVEKLIKKKSIVSDDYFERIYSSYIKQQYYLQDNRYVFAYDHSTFKIT